MTEFQAAGLAFRNGGESDFSLRTVSDLLDNIDDLFFQLVDHTSLLTADFKAQICARGTRAK